MKSIEARMGLIWIREGFGFFRKRPFLLLNLFIGYFLLTMIVSPANMYGSVLSLLLLPFFSVFFLQAIHGVSEERPFSFPYLFSVFNRPVVMRLLALGGLYLAVAVIAVYLSRFVDGGIFMRMLRGEQFEVQVLSQSRFREAFMVAAILNFLALLPLWFVAPLIAWKNMPLGQSIFYSFFTLLRIWRAFLVYLLGYLLFGFFIPMLLGTLIMMMLGQNIGLLFTSSMMLIVVVLVYCSLYSMYIYVFGKPVQVTQA